MIAHNKKLLVRLLTALSYREEFKDSTFNVPLTHEGLDRKFMKEREMLYFIKEHKLISHSGVKTGLNEAHFDQQREMAHPEEKAEQTFNRDEFDQKEKASVRKSTADESTLRSDMTSTASDGDSDSS